MNSTNARGALWSQAAHGASMRCDFCSSSLPDAEPDNLALLQHVKESKACNDQYVFLLENLRTSWTRNMSGG